MDYRLNKGDDAKNGKQRDFTTYHNDFTFLFFKILHLILEKKIYVIGTERI